MNNYLAKSFPQETIQEHTDKLLENFKIMKELYPNLEIDWDILYLACLYHDLGKMNLKFQEKIERKKLDKREIPHGVLSMFFLDLKNLRKKYSKDELKILCGAIGHHHDRKLDLEHEHLEKEVELLKKEWINFKYDKLDNLGMEIKFNADSFFDAGGINFIADDEAEKEKLFKRYVMVKGMLNKIDYAASAGIEVEIKNDFLQIALENLMKNWQEKNSEADWNELQKFMIEHRNKNVAVIAQTGMGKTEAGLLWIGDQKGFFILPLKTAINSIYQRIAFGMVEEEQDRKVGLLHSETMDMYSEQNQTGEITEIEEYYSRTKQFSLPLTVCTLDQIFTFVYRYRGFEPKLATLSYSKVVIDEIQMYSPQLMAALIIGLKYIQDYGGKFAIMTATLPRVVLDLMKEKGIEVTQAEKPFINEKIRHSVKVIEDRVRVEDIIEHYDKNKILVICNTVKEAQRVMEELKNRGMENVNLFHSKFIKRDRREKEKEILEIGDKNSKEYGIWVTTQVVEASLDIDFDYLFTELSDLNGLFQRFGRCYRARELDKEYNCIVYIGSEQKSCSGIRSGETSVVDKDIYELSRAAVLKLDGKISEKEKMELVENLYTTENLKETRYYDMIKRNMNYINSFLNYESCKSEIDKIFRDIKNIQVVPKVVYDENLEYIEEQQRRIEEGDKKEKLEAKKNLRDLTVAVYGSEYSGNLEEIKAGTLKLSDYESYPVVECEYDYELGFRPIQKEKFKIKESNIF